MLSVVYIQVHFRQDFFIEANTMNPYQTAPKGSYCLQYRLPREHKQMRGAEDKSSDWREKGYSFDGAL